MEDHAAIAVRVRRIERALHEQGRDAAAHLIAELATTFAHQVALEEAGILFQMREADQATGEICRLVEQHRKLLAALTNPQEIESPDHLEGLLTELLQHNAFEDRELYPLALQLLPFERWGLVEEVHQLLLTA